MFMGGLEEPFTSDRAYLQICLFELSYMMSDITPSFPFEKSFISGDILNMLSEQAAVQGKGHMHGIH